MREGALIYGALEVVVAYKYGPRYRHASFLRRRSIVAILHLQAARSGILLFYKKCMYAFALHGLALFASNGADIESGPFPAGMQI